MIEDREKDSRWNPTIIAALIGAIATIVATALTVLVNRPNNPPVEKPQTPAEKPAQATSSEKTPQVSPAVVDKPQAPAASLPKVTELRGDYIARAAAGTYHLKINNNGTYLMSAPSTQGSIRGSVSTSGSHVVLVPQATPTQVGRYVLGADGSLTSADDGAEQLVFTRAR
jgi:hypothetical protein